MAKQKRNIVLTGILLSTFLALYALSRTVLSDVYVFEWTSRHWYLCIWLIVVLLVFTKKQVVATALTLGNLVGVPFGQVVGDCMRNASIQKITPEMTAGQQQMMYNHHGVLLWLGIVFAFLLAGSILQVRDCKRHSNNKQGGV